MRGRLLQADIFKQIATKQSTYIRNLTYLVSSIDEPMRIIIGDFYYNNEYQIDTEKARKAAIKHVNKKLKEYNKRGV